MDIVGFPVNGPVCTTAVKSVSQSSQQLLQCVAGWMDGWMDLIHYCDQQTSSSAQYNNKTNL
jgi:hypothetical protein